VSFLQNISRDIFGNFQRLTILDLSNNYIEYIPAMTFVNSKRIQVLNFASNGLRDYHQEIFKYLDDLRVVDFSSNHLTDLYSFTFQRCHLEKIDLSNNHFDMIPSHGFNNLATMDLVDMDLSHNRIGTRNSMLQRYMFKVS
jgi:Leucine-rich repeat (LRR) protein